MKANKTTKSKKKLEKLQTHVVVWWKKENEQDFSNNKH